jgi:hypothetical protein
VLFLLFCVSGKHAWLADRMVPRKRAMARAVGVKLIEISNDTKEKWRIKYTLNRARAIWCETIIQAE